MAGDLPIPPIPAEVDVRDLDGFMLNVERLMASELVALSSHEVIAAALFLWCRAWKQLPAASLPDDDRVIAAFAKLPLPKFKRLRDQVMRGFVKCSDGRWYHTVLATEAFSAFGRKQSFQKKRETDAERLRKWRESKRETHDETQSETRFVAEGQGQGVDSDSDKKEEGEARAAGNDSQPPAKPSANSRGSRLSADWQLPKALGEWALQERPTWTPEHVRAVAEKFRDHWIAKAGREGVKLDWPATWRNWVRNEGSNPAASPEAVRSEAICCCCGAPASMKLGSEWFCPGHDQYSERRKAA